MLDRRSLLLGGAAAGVASLFRSAPAWARPGPGRAAIANPGLQLYTLRDLMTSDLPGTLAAVAEIGYREVEFAGYFGRGPEEIRQLLDRNGLRSPSAHLDLNLLRRDSAAAFELAKTIGHEWVIVAWLPPSERGKAADWRRLADEFNALGEAARRVGLRFGYHNHDFEFSPVEGRVPFDLLLEHTDPALVGFELDLYWITRAGRDPARYLRSGPGRYAMVHVKDMDASSAREMTDPGSGTIDFRALLPLARLAGVRHWFVEHDSTPDPLRTARVGYSFLQAMEV